MRSLRQCNGSGGRVLRDRRGWQRGRFEFARLRWGRSLRPGDSGTPRRAAPCSLELAIASMPREHGVDQGRAWRHPDDLGPAPLRSGLPEPTAASCSCGAQHEKKTRFVGLGVRARSDRSPSVERSPTSAGREGGPTRQSPWRHPATAHLGVSRYSQNKPPAPDMGPATAIYTREPCVPQSSSCQIL